MSLMTSQERARVETEQNILAEIEESEKRVIAALNRPTFEEAHALAQELEDAARVHPFPAVTNLMKRAATALRAGEKQTP